MLAFALARGAARQAEIEATRAAFPTEAQPDDWLAAAEAEAEEDEPDQSAATPLPRELAVNVDAAAPSPPGADSAATAQPAPSGDRPAAEEERRSAPPTESEVMAAMRQVPITLYTTRSCPVCTKARRWFQYNRIPFVEHDIEANPASKRAMRGLNPKGSVPTIHLDGEILVGWNEGEVSRLIAQGVTRRLNENR